MLPTAAHPRDVSRIRRDADESTGKSPGCDQVAAAPRGRSSPWPRGAEPDGSAEPARCDELAARGLDLRGGAGGHRGDPCAAGVEVRVAEGINGRRVDDLGPDDELDLGALEGGRVLE